MLASEVSSFLRSRRARLTPQDAGLAPHGTTRRVAGLKREEVARLAGVSVDYYARLEQGRPVGFSASVLDAVGRALQLTELDQAHLHDLVGRGKRQQSEAHGRATVLPAYERIAQVMEEQPVFVTDWRHNVLMANAVALSLFLDMGSDEPDDRNFARFVFIDPRSRALFDDWTGTAVLTAGSMRRNLARHPHDEGLQQLLGDCRISPEFEEMWEAYTLHEVVNSRKLYHHPDVGDIWVECDNVHLVGEEDQVLTVGTVERGSTSEAALSRLTEMTSAA